MEKKVVRLQAENERLAGPMKIAESQVAELKKTVSKSYAMGDSFHRRHG